MEVGGGIGATTKQILGKMEGLAYEYLFTDVSNFFLNNIRQQYPQVKTELLNLDDWDPSKFGEFHVIIAAGVLNNTKNILETVNKLKHMLRDEGILLVTEPLEEHIEITVSQAFMMPKHSDVRCMTGHCFLTEEEWIQSFDEVGLETVRIFPDEQNKYAQFKQKLFIVRKKQIVYREFLKSILPTVMIPTEFVNVDNIPLSLNGKVDRKALVRNFKRKLSSKDSIIIDQQNSKKQIYTEVEKKMIEIMRIVSGNSNISYEDNLLENGFDSLLLSQASGKIVNEIPEASGLRFDEILRVALVTPMIKMISEYIERKNSESKQKEKVESNDVPVPTSATHNVMYILGSDKGKWKEALEKTMLDSDILVKETEKEKLKTEVKSDAIANKYLLICKDNISEILAEVSELLAQEIIIQKVFLLNPEDAKNNDLYLGDVIVINGAPSVITAIVGAGLFPGVSGWLLYSELKRRGGKQLIEIVIGGKYNFSRGAAIDYVEEIKENAAGVPMACIRNGNIVPASSMVPSNIISDVCGLAFLPYVTEEIQEIIYTNEALNIDAYTAVPKEMFTTLNKLYGKNEEIIKYLVKGNNSNQRGIIQFKRISENETKTIFIRGSNPGDLTGKILAISANAILYGKKKRGIFTMANYLSDYPLIDKLKGIKGFEYREEVQYA